MIVKSICDLNLHDSVLLSVQIVMDEVTLHLRYIDDYKPLKCSHKKLVFRECSEFISKMNPGHVPPNPILGGDELPCEQPYRKICIEMNTTAGRIEILAKSVELLDADNL